MKLKSFLLGVSLATCGAAFGQLSATEVYLPDADLTLYSSNIEVTQDGDENTTVKFQSAYTSVSGNQGGCDKPYLGNVSGYSGPWGPYSTIICNFNSPVQCVWTN